MDEEKLIKGVEINELKVFTDKRGAVMRMMRKDDPFFHRFGEIYFSIVYVNVVKGWHLHKSMTLNYACVFGAISLALFDPRKGSPTLGIFNTIRLDGYPLFTNYSLVTVPHGIWNGFRHDPTQGLVSVVANCATEPHRPDEIVRRSPKSYLTEYDWGAYEVAG